jgi:hypothetical protein
MKLQSVLSAVAAASFVLLPVIASAQEKPTIKDAGEGVARRITLENAYLRVVVNPGQGGRIESFIHKKSGKELTQPLTATVPGGLLSDGIVQQNFWHGDWTFAPYAAKVLAPAPDAVQLQLASPPGDQWTGLTFTKVLTLRRDSSALQVAYTIASDENADPRARPDFHFHQGLAGEGKVFLPSEAGVLARPASIEPESWVWTPSRGWMGFVQNSGTGLGAAFDFKRVQALRTAQTPIPTMEWFFRKADFKPGTTESTTVTLGAFSGLKEIAAVGARAAVEMDVSEPKNGQANLRLVFAPFQNFAGKLSVSVRPMNATQGEPDFTENLKLETDKLSEIKKTIKLPGAGHWVVRGVLEAPDSNLVFEQPVLVPGGSGTYAMLPLEKRVPEFPDSPTWARYKPIDLNFNSLGVPTPHREWVKKWAGGKPRVLALLSPTGLREAVEMMQRFDMDITAPFLEKSTYYVLGDSVRALKIEAIQDNLRKALEKDYDVIVVSAYDGWSFLPDEAKKKIAEKVKAGTGLVVPLRGAPPDELKEFYPLEFFGYDHLTGKFVRTEEGPPILNALPYDALPTLFYANGARLRKDAEGKPAGQVLLRAVYNGQDRGPLVAVTEQGKARIAFSHTEGSIVPGYGKFATRDAQPVLPAFDYWEYHYALMARLIYWAAKKEAPVDLLKIDGADGEVRVLLDAKTAGDANVELTARDEFGQVLETVNQKIVLKTGEQTVTVPLSEKARQNGAYLADVMVRNSSGTLAFGAGTIPRGAIKIAELKPAQEVYGRTESATINAKIDGAIPAGATVRAELWDGFGRQVAATQAPAAAETKITLPLSDLLSPRYQVRASLVANGGVLDQEVTEGLVKAERDYTRIKLGFWGGAGGGAENVVRGLYDTYRKMGMNANWAGEAQTDYDLHILQFLNWPHTRSAGASLRTAGGVTKEQAEKAPVEKGNVIVNPESPQQFFESGAKQGAAYKNEDVLLYSTSDENRASPKDVDFSENGKKALRAFLQKYFYKNIGELNAEWKTNYRSFDEVVAMTEAEAKEHLKSTGSIAPWLDQRLYMAWGAAQLADAVTKGVRSQDGAALVGESGSQEPAVYGTDRDWWHMARAYNALAAYGGVQTGQQSSYNPDLVRYTWAGYGKPSPLNRAAMYGALGNMNNGLLIFSGRSHVDPDFTLSEPGRSVAATLNELQRGIGQMLVTAKVEQQPVYVLQSHASIMGAYMLGLEPLNKTSRYQIIQLLNDIGIQFHYISYEQLASGQLSKTDAKVLILPATVALSPAEVAATRAFVQAGGTLIADAQIGLMTGHGRLYDKPQLDDVFGLDRSKAELVAAEKDQAFSKEEDGAAVLQIKTVESGISGTAKPMLTVNGAPGAVPILYHNTFGKGHAYYWAADILSAYDAATNQVKDATAPQRIRYIQNLFERMLKTGGVTPPLEVHERGSDDKRAPWVWTNLKRLGAARLVLLNRNYGIMDAAPEDEPVTLQLQEPGAIYDVVAGKLLGRGNAVDLTLTNDTGRVFSVLPSAVTGVRAQATSSTPARGQTVTVSVSVLEEKPTHDPRVVRVDVTQPDGSPSWGYSKDEIFEGPAGKFTIPFALNDPIGLWRVRVTDVLSGVSEEVSLKLQ